MIKLERPPEPQILADNQAAWTEHLCSLVDLHGGYDKIPKDEKDSALQFYRHDHIREALKASAFSKCAFCECIPEETGYPEVEHFHPKSRYPGQAFKWINLLYSCKTCNVNKLNHDTVSAPIINPYDIDPQELIEYDSIIIRAASGPHLSVAEKTISVCGLDDARLFRPRAAVLVSFCEFEKQIREALDDFREARTRPNKERKAARISNALSTIEQLTQPSAKMSGYCNSLLKKSAVYNEAKSAIYEYLDQEL